MHSKHLELEFEDFSRPKGYQPRIITDRLSIGKSRRWCRTCNKPIEKGISHLSIESHLSSGHRSYIHVCPECLTKFYMQMVESIKKGGVKCQ